MKKSAKKVLGKDTKNRFKTSIKVYKKIKTVTKKEVTKVNWDVSIKNLERKKILKKQMV